MVEVNTPNNGGNATRRLSRSSGGGGNVRQSFSGGKSRSVQVETRRRIPAGEAKLHGKLADLMKRKPKREASTEKPAPAPAAARAKPTSPEPAAATPSITPAATASDGGVLTAGETLARTEALAKAVSADNQEAERLAKEAEAESLRRMQEMAEAAAKAEQVARQQQEEEERRARQLAKERDKEKSGADQQDTEVVQRSRRAGTDEDGEEASGEGDEQASGRKARRGAGGRGGRTLEQRPRRQGKLTIAQALVDDEQRQRSFSSLHRQRQRRKGTSEAARGKVRRTVTIPDTITVQELASRMAERAVDVVKFLANQGTILKAGDYVDAETAQIAAEELGHLVKRVSEDDIETELLRSNESEEYFVPRSPVVTIMGHVDHGKTSLLDALKQTKVAASEAGGITQHIGAYRVELDGGGITFIDTPGHEAFTAMRVRGANVTDIVILVVAADDGVKPQTKEAISHAKAAGVPIIVAINKMDLPSANPQQVRNELAQAEVYVESAGGDVIEVEISALKHTNLDKLLELVLLQAELLELKADPRCFCAGVVVESRMERGRGAVATLLVQRGTIKPGDIVLAGTRMGRVRTLRDDRGNLVKKAGPSMPVEVDGLSGTPLAGDEFHVVASESQAKEVAQWREHKAISAVRAEGLRVDLGEDPNALFQGDSKKQVPVIVKADVQGAVEAVQQMVQRFDPNSVDIKILHGGAGQITENDINLALASGALVLGFNVGIPGVAAELAAVNNVKVITGNVIFELVDAAKAYVSGQLEPEEREVWLGNAKVLEVFANSRVGKVAGCMVNDGAVQRHAVGRVMRDGKMLFAGPVASLRRYREEVEEVTRGLECGIAIAGYRDFQVGDEIDCHTTEQVVRQI